MRYGRIAAASHLAAPRRRCEVRDRRRVERGARDGVVAAGRAQTAVFKRPLARRAVAVDGSSTVKVLPTPTADESSMRPPIALQRRQVGPQGQREREALVLGLRPHLRHHFAGEPADIQGLRVGDQPAALDPRARGGTR